MIDAYVIRSMTERDDWTGEALYWNNEDGWVSRDSATEFSPMERRELRLPISGIWMEA